MKTTIYSLLLASMLVFFFSCDKKEDNEPGSISGKLVSNSDCKNNLKTTAIIYLPADSLSCIEYQFDEKTNKLSIKHINAAFNCCPDSLYTKIEVSGDTIIIQELEKGGNCYCNCLYDLNIELTGVEKKSYIIKMVEPYRGEQKELLMNVNFMTNNQGSFCVTRKQYPWGGTTDYTLNTAISGKLVSNTACKNNLKTTAQINETADTLSKVEYQFDENTNKLTIKHINAAFNCCPESLFTEIKVSGDTIIIEEFEKSKDCKCNCLYDLDIELTGVVKKSYIIKVLEPYLGDQNQLLFDVNLQTQNQGSFCVVRNQYPWGN